MKEAALALLFVTMTTTSCSSSTDDGAAWCAGLADFTLAGVAFDAAANESPEQAAAAADLEAAFLAIAEAPVPGEIEADFDELKKGPDVQDAGDSFSETAKRVSDWALANCGYSPDMVELLESEGPRIGDN